MGLALHQLNEIKHRDPHLYEVLSEILKRVQNVEFETGTEPPAPGSLKPQSLPGTPGSIDHPEAPFVFADAIGLGITFNIVPPQGAKNYQSFKHYTISLYTDRERRKLERTHKGSQVEWATSLTVMTPGVYYWSVTAINAVGEGAPATGKAFVDGVSPAPKDGVPGVPSVSLVQKVMGGDQAQFRLTRPSTGFNQIGLYLIVARENSTFDFLYSPTSFTGSTIKGSSLLNSTTIVFASGDVGKLVELTGVEFNLVTGQRHLYIIKEVVSGSQVRLHVNLPFTQASVTGRIGTPWWKDSQYVNRWDIFVQGPQATQSPDHESFAFHLPFDGKTVYLAATAISVYGYSDWSSTIAVTTGSRALASSRGIQPVIGTSFTPTSYRRVSWTSGSVYYPDGGTESINSGSTGNLPTNVTRWVYKVRGNVNLQVSSSIANATGLDRFPVAIVRTTSDTGEFASVVTLVANNKGSVLSARNLTVGKLSALSADLGEITAGKITGLQIKTSSSGSRIELDSTNGFRAIDSSGDVRVKIPTSGDLVEFSGYGRITGDILIDPNTGLGVGSMFLRPVFPQTNNFFLGSSISEWCRISIQASNQIYINCGELRVDGALTMVGTNSDIDLSGNDIGSVGDVELDSLTKDGNGNISVNDDLNLSGNDLLNVGDVELDSLTKDGTGDISVNDNLDLSGNDILNVGDVELDSLTKDGTGNIAVNDNLDLSGNDILNVGDVECDSLTKDGTGNILLNDAIVPSGSGDTDPFLGTTAIPFNRVSVHRVLFDERGAPATPSSTHAWLYTDSNSGDLVVKFDSGNTVTVATYV